MKVVSTRLGLALQLIILWFSAFGVLIYNATVSRILELGLVPTPAFVSAVGIVGVVVQTGFSIVMLASSEARRFALLGTATMIGYWIATAVMITWRMVDLVGVI